MKSTQDTYAPGEFSGQTALGFLAGALIGGLAAAGTMLLFAPQSGKQTRDQIRQKSLELRDQATETVEEAVAQARATSRHISESVQQQAEKLQHRGQEMLAEQKERWSPVVEAGKKAAAGSEG
jgi:gas vesicle protein